MYSPRLSKAATTLRSESSSTGRTTCLESDSVSRTGADFMGHTSTLSLKHTSLLLSIESLPWRLITLDKAHNQHHCSLNLTHSQTSNYTTLVMCTEWHDQVTHMSLGWYWSFRIGEGKRNLWSQSPVRTSHWETILSVEALTSLWPSLLQLRICKQTMRNSLTVTKTVTSNSRNYNS